jgi:hypothetical protein
VIYIHVIKELNPRRRVYVEIPKPARVELKCSHASGFDVILATPERVLVSQHRPDTEGLISILKCLKLTIDIIFQSHFIAHLMRSNARDHANPDSGPATTSQAIPARRRFSRQIKWTICIGFSVDFTLNVLLAFRNYRR